MSLSIQFRALVVVALLTGATVLRAQVPDDAQKPDASPSPDAAAAESVLTADLFYRLLLGDVALQRGDVTLAARAYIDAARVAADARLARRATEIAIASRQRTLVEDAAKLWSQLDPAAERPKRVLASLASDAA
jgi:hypothetical protein